MRETLLPRSALSRKRASDLDGHDDFFAVIHLVANGLLHEEALAVVAEAVAAGGAHPGIRPTEDLVAILRARGPGERGAEERDRLRQER